VDIIISFQRKKKFVIALVLIAKCYFSWVHRERKKGWRGGGGGKRLWAKTRIEKGKKKVPRC
jgi:hypothetical protein